MIPRVKPEGMLFGKPLRTFPDHALGLTIAAINIVTIAAAAE